MLVADLFLNKAGIEAVFDQMRHIGTPQRMERHRVIDAGLVADVAKPCREVVGPHPSVAFSWPQGSGADRSEAWPAIAHPFIDAVDGPTKHRQHRPLLWRRAAHGLAVADSEYATSAKLRCVRVPAEVTNIEHPDLVDAQTPGMDGFFRVPPAQS